MIKIKLKINSYMEQYYMHSL